MTHETVPPITDVIPDFPYSPAIMQDTDTGNIGQVKSYRDLFAWRKAISLVTRIYATTMTFPKHETYGLSSQLRRAAVSIASNIAEGHGRRTSGEFVQFLCQGRGSLCEVETQIVIARELLYINADEEKTLLAQTDRLGRILNGLIASIERRKFYRAKGANLV